MAESSKFWEIWAPYLSYLENNYLDLEGIRKLMPIIKSPTLVVGAGQGLLVEEILRHGHSVTGIDYEPLMIEYAKKRRGLDLILADATDIPDDDNKYETTIIATGVVDFMEDENIIKSIIHEAQRVTNNSGVVLIAFYRFHPKTEKLLKFLGLITSDGFWKYRLSCDMFRLGLTDMLKAIKEETGAGYLKSFLTLLRIQLTTPKKERLKGDNWKLLWKQACRDLDDPEQLINSSPELLPFRDEESIRALFSKLNGSISNITNFDSCTVVQL